MKQNQMTLGAIGVFLLSATQGLGADGATSKAHDQMMASMNQMNREMMEMKSEQNADVDFTKMMIRHHQAGIDMMKSELDHGSDPAMKAKAKKMIESQKKDIQELQAWLIRHEKPQS